MTFLKEKFESTFEKLIYWSHIGIVTAHDSTGISELSEAHLSVTSKNLQPLRVNEWTKVAQWLHGSSNRLINQNEMTASLPCSRGLSQGDDDVARGLQLKSHF